MSDRRQGAFESIRDAFSDALARGYLIAGGAALVVFYAQMSERGGDTGAILAVLLAVPGLLARWTISPILFLLLGTYLIIDPSFNLLIPSYAGSSRSWFRTFGRRGAEVDWEDLLLVTSMFVYIAAQYRLLSLLHHGMPDDPPPRRKGQEEPEIPRRPSALANDSELPWLLGSLPIFIGVGTLGWLVLAKFESTERLGQFWGIERSFARLMLFVWFAATVAIVFNVGFRYWALRTMGRERARLMLRDIAWHETRREQERLAKWARWRRDRKGARRSSGGGV